MVMIWGFVRFEVRLIFCDFWSGEIFFWSEFGEFEFFKCEWWRTTSEAEGENEK